MKLTIFSNGVSNGGAERVTCNLANYFVENGYDVDLLTMSDDEPTYYIDEKVRRIELINKSERKGFVADFLLRVRRIKRYCTISRTDCYIGIMQTAWICLLLLRKKIRNPIIITERSDPHNYSSRMQWILTHLLHRADACVFQTEGQFGFYRKWLGKCKGVKIPNAINVTTEPLDWSKREKKVIAIGRLQKVKNYPMLIRAFSRAARQNGDYVLEIFGEGKERETLENIIKESGMEKRIRLCGFDRNVAEQLRTSKIYVLSSDHEGMPNALIEAMATGVACISTDCEAGAPREIINGDNGILVPVGDEQALYEALCSLMKDDRKAEMMAQNAIDIRSRFSRESVYGMWGGLVQTLIEENARA